MKLVLFFLLLCLSANAEESKPSKPRAGQSSGNTSAPTNNTHSSNQTQSSFASDSAVMP